MVVHKLLVVATFSLKAVEFSLMLLGDMREEVLVLLPPKLEDMRDVVLLLLPLP